MKYPQDDFLLAGARFFEKRPFLCRVVAQVYLSVLIPFLELFCQFRFGSTFKIIPRHSLLNDTFNPFLSDIDTTLVFKENDEDKLDDVLMFFFKLNKRTKVFDLPQVYLEEEWNLLVEAQAKYENNINVIWNFRKLTWIKSNSMLSQYEIFKKTRSLGFLKRKIFKELKESPYLFSDLGLGASSDQGPLVCCWSQYLELTTGSKILLLTTSELNYLFALLPGETPSIPLSSEQLEFKEALCLHEYLLSRSHIRIFSRMGEDCSKGISFIRWLEKQYNLHFSRKIVLEGPNWDFLKKAQA